MARRVACALWALALLGLPTLAVGQAKAPKLSKEQRQALTAAVDAARTASPRRRLRRSAPRSRRRSSRCSCCPGPSSAISAATSFSRWATAPSEDRSPARPIRRPSAAAPSFGRTAGGGASYSQTAVLHSPHDSSDLLLT